MEIVFMQMDSPETKLLFDALKTCSDFSLSSLKTASSPNVIVADAVRNSKEVFEQAQEIRNNAIFQNVPLLFLIDRKTDCPLPDTFWIHPIKNFPDLLSKLARVNVAILNRSLNFLVMDKNTDGVKKYTEHLNCNLLSVQDDLSDIDLIITTLETRDQALKISASYKEAVPVFIVSSAQDPVCGFYDDALKTFCARIKTVFKQGI